MGTCCPLCWADTVKSPDDRSFTKGLAGGVGINNNADPILCRDAVCPPLQCPEYDQMFDGRCCTKCSSAAAVTPADLALSYKENAAASMEAAMAPVEAAPAAPVEAAPAAEVKEASVEAAGL